MMASTSSRKDKPALPLESTLRDLALLRASDVDLSTLLSSSTQSTAPTLPGDGLREEDEAAVQRSREFVRSARAALHLHARGEAEKLGERVDSVRAALEDVLSGLQSNESSTKDSRTQS